MSKLSSRRDTLLGFQPPAIGEEEIAAVTEPLRSGWLTSGPRAAELERRMADYLEAEHVLALASGTAALHLSLVALGIGPGDEVITTPITWPATANVIVHTGATPVFVDARETDLNIDPESIALVQLDKVERHAEIRARQFAMYDEAVAELDGIDALARDARDTHALHLYIVRIDAERAGAPRDEYQRALAGENIATSIHFLPVHTLTYYRERFPGTSLPVAERAGREVLSLPVSPAHSDDDIRDAVTALRRVHAHFTA